MNRFFLTCATIILLLGVTSCAGTEIPEEYSQFKTTYSSLPLNQEIPVGELFKMKLGGFFLWVTKGNGPAIPYLKPFRNTCIKIPAELTSVHYNTTALIDVSVCNIKGEFYYRVPITS